MKQELQDIYQNLDKTAFWVCLITSIILIGVSFLIPPLAVVDGSVLAAVGEIFGFAALATVIVAIHKGKAISVSHGDTTIEVKHPDSDDSPDGEEA